jgi:hypothetical protein
VASWLETAAATPDAQPGQRVAAAAHRDGGADGQVLPGLGERAGATKAELGVPAAGPLLGRRRRDAERPRGGRQRASHQERGGARHVPSGLYTTGS